LNGIQEVSGSIPLISTKENLETTMVSRFSFCPDQVAVLCSSNAFLTAKHAPYIFQHLPDKPCPAACQRRGRISL
jgi:hypothetical protein